MEDAKSVWNFKQDIFNILQPIWISGYRRRHCFVQRKGNFPTIHTQETQTFWHQNFTNRVTYTNDMTLYSLLDGGEEISYRNARFIFVNDILATMAQVGRHENHSAKVGLSRSVKVTQPKYHVWTASGGKSKVFSEVWRKYDVCVIRRCFWHYHTKAQPQNSEAGISYANVEPATEM
jgi:hypothetical protein